MREVGPHAAGVAMKRIDGALAFGFDEPRAESWAHPHDGMHSPRKDLAVATALRLRKDLSELVRVDSYYPNQSASHHLLQKDQDEALDPVDRGVLNMCGLGWPLSRQGVLVGVSCLRIVEEAQG